MDDRSIDRATEVAEDLFDKLGIITPNGRTVTRMTMISLSQLAEGDVALKAQTGELMSAVDICFSDIKKYIGLSDFRADNEKASSAFGEMAQAALIMQSRYYSDYRSAANMSTHIVNVSDFLGIADHALVACALSNVDTMDRKNRDYGSNNVSEYGAMGVLVRMRDKYHRASRLHANGGVSAVNDESLFDTWGDMTNYAHIGNAICLGIWRDN